MAKTLQEINELYRQTFYTEDEAILPLIMAIVVGSKLPTPPVWLYLVGPSSGGKCLGKGTPVLMYDGTVKVVEEVRIGDVLMGDDSTPRTVLSTTKGREMLYRVHQERGDGYTVNKSHILSLLSKKEKKDISVLDYLSSSKNFKNLHRGYRVPVEFSHTPVPVDPYFLGIWLGDGRSNSTAICKPDREIKDFIQSYAKELGLRFSTYDYEGRCPSYAIIGEGKKKTSSLYKKMETLGLWKKKHVPHLYLSNSRKVRLAVLAGLLDSDGYLKESGAFEFCNKSEKIADNIVFLARSLGFTARKRPTKKTIKSRNFTGRYWRIYIGGDTHLIPTKIKRKIAVLKKKHTNHLTHGIQLENIGVGNYYGFEIDGNKRFLLGDFTVTHNTELINIFSKVPFVTQVSDLTPNTFLSGMAGSSKEASLLNRLGLNFVITMKDFTTILSKAPESQEAIIAQMREIYDGHLVKETGTGKTLTWGPNGKATFLMATTEGIYSVQEKFADMGTRAINYVLKPQDRIATTKRALRKSSSLNREKIAIQDAVLEFIMEKLKKIPTELPDVDEKLEDQIIEVANFSSICRSVVKRDYRGEKSLALSAEMPMRMAKQLLSSAQLLTFVNDGVLTQPLIDCVFKTGFDSIPKQRRLILEVMAKYVRVNVVSVATLINYKPERAREWIEDLNMFGVCDRIQRGQKEFWEMKHEYRQVMLRYHPEIKALNEELDDSGDPSMFSGYESGSRDVDKSWAQGEAEKVTAAQAEVAWEKI